MKLKCIMFLIGSLTFSINANAQITIKSNDVAQQSKIPKLDSLSNLTIQSEFVNYKQYIGYKLFFVPRSKSYEKSKSYHVETKYTFLFRENNPQSTKSQKNSAGKAILNGVASNIGLNVFKNSTNDGYVDITTTNVYKPKLYPETNPGTYAEFGTIPEEVEGKYFTILDIKGRQFNFGDKEDKEYLALENIEGESKSSTQLKILLKNDANQDTLYWATSAESLDNGPFFLVPYFEKRKKGYLNTNFISMGGSYLVKDAITGESLQLAAGEKWHCYDISFAESKNSWLLIPCYFLKNDSGKELAIQLGTLDPRTLMPESEYRTMENEQKQEENRLKSIQLADEKKLQAEKIKLKNYYTKKFGAKIANYINDGKVVLGMNKEMCTASWGEPNDVNRTIINGLTSEQWVYGLGKYLYFKNGLLSAIQD